MTYKNRVIVLCSMIGAMALIYAGSIIFNSGMISDSSSHTWLDSRTAQRVTRIVIDTQEQGFELIKRTNQWFVLHNGHEYPARQIRIDDFLSVFTKRASWPVRSTSDATHERFGMLEENASRVTIYGEYSVLLDLLFGNDDIFRNETYIRKAGNNEVRSGDSSVRVYLTSPVSSWFNLRLIPESENENFDIGNVQKLSVTNGAETQVFSRANRRWEISGVNAVNPSQNIIETYIRTILNLEGDNFIDTIHRDDPVLNHNRIEMELGNGRIITIRLSEADETGRMLAHAGGREYIYSIPSWSAGRIFRPALSFETQ